MSATLSNKPDLPVAEVAELCRRYQVRELSLFGSGARGEMRPDSDLDFLVEFEESARVGFLMFAGLSRELSDLLHCPVDLVPKDGLKPRIRAQVLAEAEVIYVS